MSPRYISSAELIRWTVCSCLTAGLWGASAFAQSPSGATNSTGDKPAPTSTAKTPTASTNVSKAKELPLSPALANVFDGQRNVWPDRMPPPPPPPPPPMPPAVTDQDMQLYGVVVAGAVKKATVKVGKRFATLAADGRGFANLTEGQFIGEFTVAQILPTHIVLTAPGGQQPLYFTKKTDRGAASQQVAQVAMPVQGGTDPQTQAANSPGGAPANASGSSPDAGSVPAPPPAPSSPLPAAAALGNALGGTGGGVQSPGAESPANSLAAALAAARANAQQNMTGQPAPVFGNPFVLK